MGTRTIATGWHVCVVIPARNEEALLAECLRSVARACEELRGQASCDVVLAVDASTDRTWEVGRRFLRGRGAVVRTWAGNVGLARAKAAELGLERAPVGPELCWLANTDADCVVPRGWLVDQLRLAEAGVGAVTGTVDVRDFSEHRPEVEERFRQSYRMGADGTHPHVHGANLGVRGDAYLLAGGWGALTTAEDHDLWRRLRRSGCRLQPAAGLQVITSGRRVGRAPQGFADALAKHNEAVA